MYATKIKMKTYCKASMNLTEIEEIYITGNALNGYYKKEYLYTYLQMYPDSIKVNIYPYPNLVPAQSKYGEKYVRSQPNDTQTDNLLKLPRE